MRVIRYRIYEGKYKENTIRYFIQNHDDGSSYGEIWIGFLSVICNRSINGNTTGGKAKLGVETFEGMSDVELQKRMNDWLEEKLNEKIDMIIEKEINYSV